MRRAASVGTGALCDWTCHWEPMLVSIPLNSREVSGNFVTVGQEQFRPGRGQGIQAQLPPHPILNPEPESPTWVSQICARSITDADLSRSVVSARAITPRRFLAESLPARDTAAAILVPLYCDIGTLGGIELLLSLYRSTAMVNRSILQ